MTHSGFIAHFSIIQDTRQLGKVRHPLISIFFIAVAATIADCDDWDEVELWANEKKEWLEKFVPLPEGIPSVSTFQRVFQMINSKQFEKCFVTWAKDLVEDMNRRNVAIDGKTARGAKLAAGEKSAIHIVSAYLCEQGLTLGEVKTKEKSNEMKTIPELLRLLDIMGAIVTIDAAGTYADIASQIVKENKADYVLALKGNQPHMYRDVALQFTGIDVDKWRNPSSMISDAAIRIRDWIADGKPMEESPAFINSEYQTTFTTNKGHGRIERRDYFLINDISWMRRSEEWVGLKSVGMAVTTATNVKTGITTTDARFFICSVDNVTSFANAVRSHWGIESNHWTLDLTFGEDKSRIRKDREPQNVATIRRLALNFLKVEQKKGTRKITKPKMRKLAMMRDDYLERIMVGNLM